MEKPDNQAMDRKRSKAEKKTKLKADGRTQDSFGIESETESWLIRERTENRRDAWMKTVRRKDRMEWRAKLRGWKWRNNGNK